MLKIYSLKQQKLPLLAISLLAIFIFTAQLCFAQRPTITSFSPTSGAVGTPVTITGTNFNTTAANNIVYFGATRATVTAATATSLSVTAPAGATYQPISVLNTASNLTGYSTSPYITTFTNPFGAGNIPVNYYNPMVDFTTGTQPYLVSIGDVNGDGKPDLVVVNYGSNTVSVYRNTSSTSGRITSGSFAAKVDFTTGTNPTSVSIGDVDGDGKPDLAVTNAGSNTVSVFRNLSTSGSITTGSFAAKVDFATGSAPYSVSIGDVDGDGKPDLAVTNASSATVSVLRNTATSGSITTGSFAAKVDFATGTQPYSVSIGDVDGDGKPDLAVANYGSNTVSVLRNVSTPGSITTGSFAAKVDFATGTNPQSVSIGDLDGDGKPDLAVTNQISNTVSVLRNTATSGTITTGSFAAKVDFTTGTNPRLVSIGDVDGDGKPDLAVTNFGSNTVSIYRNISTPGSITTGSFAAKVDFTAGTNSRSISIGDVDGDGRPDLAVANFGSNTVSVLQMGTRAPTITSFSPTSGAVGTSVTITGTNFNITAANNVVYFGAVRATVTAAATNSLSVTVPAGATYQPISVLNTASNFTGYSTSAYITTFTNPFGAGNIPANYYNPKVDFATGGDPFSVSIGDLDGDGKPDLVVANYGSDMVSVYRNIAASGSIAAGSFAAKVDFATGTQPCSVSIGDVDGDGKPDLVVTNFGSNTISVFRNTSTSGSITTGSFAAKVDFTTGTNPRSVSIGDIDGDGKPDLAVTNYASSTVSVLQNTAASGSITTSSFAAKVDFTTGTAPFSVSIGDVDGDGKPDLAVTNFGSNTVSVFRNTFTSGSITTGSFAAKVDFTTGVAPQSVSIGDVDGDGKLDLVVANSSSNSISVLRNTATSGSITTGSFAAKVDFTTGIFPYSVSIGDVDGDGKPDLAVANYASATVSVLQNTTTPGSITTGSFADKVDFTTGSFPISVSIGDVDGDGKPDLAVADRNSNTVSVLRMGSPPPPTITSFSPTSGVVGTPVTITGTNFNITAANNIVYFGAVRATVTTAAANSLSVTVPAGATYQPLSVLNTVSNLTGYSASPYITTFTNPFEAGNIPANYYNPIVDFTTGTQPYSVAIGDIDGDGKPDLAVANFGSNTVSVYRNTSTSGSIATGSFAAKVDFTTGAGPYSVSIGDVDGDGKPDLMVANSNSATVSVLRNVSISGSITTGSFVAKVDFATGAVPFSVSTGDVDGDGKPDLAVANAASNTVSVLRNTATSGTITTGSFAAKVDFTTGTAPFSVSIGDVDGDGKPDLAVANYSSNTVSVFRNTSTSGSITTSSFAAKVDFTTGVAPQSVSIGDLDGDGKPDLAVTNQSSGTVSVFRNVSTSGSITTGSFAAKVDFTTGTFPYSVSIGDVDGDGKPDLAVANVASNTVSVLRNVSTPGSITTGSFAAKVDFATGTNPYSVFIGDVDGDGRPDLAVANSGSGTVSVLQMGSPPPPTITSFSPTSGAVGTSVTITGTNFNTTAANNIVYFGATRATVTAAAATSLSVTVPAGATYQPISVLNAASNLTGYSTSPYITTFTNPFGAGNIPANYYNPMVDFTTGAGPYSVSIGDLDGDGKPDLTVANSSSDMVSVFRNTSTSGSITTGSFAAKVDFTTGSLPLSVSIGDVDGDGKPDLVVTNLGSNTVSVFRNTSTSGSITTGSFAAKVDFTTGTAPYSVSIGDVDGDGKPDLAVVNAGSNTVSVYRNVSTSGSITTGSFAAKVDFATGSSPRSVSIGDVDGDGKPDLAVANSSSNTVSVFRNTATSGSITTGSFAAKVDFATGTNPQSVSIGDIDGDGRLDLTMANSNSNTVSVFRNTATSGTITTGSFAAKVDFTTGTNPRLVSIGDVDGDGKPDLAVTNAASNTVSVLRNGSTLGSITTGSFAAKVDFATGSGPQSVSIGDVDGDGKPDLAMVNGGSNTVSVLQMGSPPTVTQPANQTLCNGAATTAVNFSGTGASYSWVNNTPGIGLAATGTGDIASFVAANTGATPVTATITVTPSTNGYSGIPQTFTITVNPSGASAPIATATTTITQNQLPNSTTVYGTGCSALIASMQGSGTVPVSGSFNASVYVEPTVPSGYSFPFVRRHYDLTPADANMALQGTGTVILYFTQADFDNYNSNRGGLPALPTSDTDPNAANLRIVQQHGSSATGMPGTYTGWAGTTPSSISIIPASVVWSTTFSRWEVTFPVTGFSGFFATTGNSIPLPLHVLRLSGSQNGNCNNLQWETVGETNVSTFTLQVSTDGIHFTGIYSTAALYNNQPGSHVYKFNDCPSPAGKIFYRIISKDIDGRERLSNTVFISGNNASSLQSSLRPNPAKGSTSLVLGNTLLLHTTAVITNSAGQMVIKTLLTDMQQQINLSALAAGVYYIHLNNGEALKLVKE